MFTSRLIKRVFAGIASVGMALVLAQPAQASDYRQFVSFTNSVLDGFEPDKGSSAGFRAARALFDEPKYAEMDWNGAGLLCRFFSGDSSANGGAAAADAVWPVEKVLLDTFRSAGGAVNDWQEFMLVRFTVLTSAVNVRCPAYNSLMMGPFSDALYATFDRYRASQAGSSTPSTAQVPLTADESKPYGTITVLSRPQFLGTSDDGQYTRILFPVPTEWDTWGVTYTARFASNDKVFCRWTAVFDQQVFDTPGQGNCAGFRTKKLRGKTRWMYLEAKSDLGKVTSDPFQVEFSKSKWGD